MTYIQYLEMINSIEHTLGPGETVSEVLQAKGYKKLYGKYGPVNQTMWKNGLSKERLTELKVGDKLILPYDPNIAQGLGLNITPKKEKSSQQAPTIEATPPKAPLKERPIKEEAQDLVYLKAGYGAKFYSFSQSGALSGGEVGELAPHFFGLETGVEKGSFSYWAKLDFNEVKVQSEQGNVRESLGSYGLGLGLGNFYIEGNLKQSLLFVKEADSLSSLKLSAFYARLGLKKKWKLSWEKTTEMQLKVFGGHFVSGSFASGREFKASEQKGQEVGAEFNFSRKLFAGNADKTFYYFNQDLIYGHYEANLKGDASGKIELQELSGSFSIGLEWRF